MNNLVKLKGLKNVGDSEEHFQETGKHRTRDNKRGLGRRIACRHYSTRGKSMTLGVNDGLRLGRCCLPNMKELLLEKLFNEIKNKSEFRREWKTALVQPLYTGKENQVQPGKDRDVQTRCLV